MKEIFLPRTNFGIKASGDLIKSILQYWKGLSYFKNDSIPFVLHDGPPFPNGMPHIGHFMNKTIKDSIARSMRMTGKNVMFVPGWDCHGLPIEWKVEQEEISRGLRKDQIPVSEFREKCKEFASHWIKVHEEVFRNMGISHDWEYKYTTMDSRSEARIIESLYQFVAAGATYIGWKPVMWSIYEETALAEAEIEYKLKQSRSIYVGFPLDKNSLECIKNKTNGSIDLNQIDLLVWTTTPWTIPMNKAVACRSDIDYSLISDGVRHIFVAANLVEQLSRSLKKNFIEVAKVTGEDLLGLSYTHPIYTDRVYSVINSDHVESSTGTGFVHIAPGHGLEDFELGLKYKLEISQSVDSNGCYSDDIKLFAGKKIFESEEDVINALGANLYSQEIISHSYPHSWRSKKPLIYRLTEQIFLNLDLVRSRVIDAIDRTEWTPDSGANRMKLLLQNRKEWCISRQRCWGVPIAILFDKVTKEIFSDHRFISYLVNRISRFGVNFWFEETLEEILTDFGKRTGVITDHNRFVKVDDIIDVWFESGNTHKFWFNNLPDELKEVARKHRIDLYVEGEDQYRGWFQSSAVLGISDQLEYQGEYNYPYSSVISHGMIVRQDTKEKFSKSSGNNETIEDLCNQYGLEAMRLWVLCSDYTMPEIAFGNDVMEAFKEMAKKVRNTIRFILGNIFSDNNIPDPITCGKSCERCINTNGLSYDQLPQLEQFILNKLNSLSKNVKESFASFDTKSAFRDIYYFCCHDLSKIYFDIRRDSLYCDDINSNTRICCKSTLFTIAIVLIKLLAPFMIFTAEESWLRLQNWLKGSGDEMILAGKSVHSCNFELECSSWANNSISDQWDEVLKLKKEVNELIELKRKTVSEPERVKSSLQVKVIVTAKSLPKWLTEEILAEALIVSRVHLEYRDIEQPLIVIEQIESEKCLRCWKYLDDLVDQLCRRCCS